MEEYEASGRKTIEVRIFSFSLIDDMSTFCHIHMILITTRIHYCKNCTATTCTIMVTSGN